MSNHYHKEDPPYRTSYEIGFQYGKQLRTQFGSGISRPPIDMMAEKHLSWNFSYFGIDRNKYQDGCWHAYSGYSEQTTQ